MWLAKPVSALTSAERSAWASTLAAEEARQGDVPLSQTLSWAAAIEAVSGSAHLVFSPEEGAGGLLFATRDRESGKLALECVNGPLIRWDDAGARARQLATFAVAASKLSRDFGSLVLRPRWESGRTEQRLRGLPVEARAISHAATIQVPLGPTQAEIRQGLSSRLRRSIAQTEKRLLQTEWKQATADDFDELVPRFRAFGERKGFTVPPADWFRALCASRGELSLWIATAETDPASGPAASAQLLVCFARGKAHYLFGHEARAPGTRSSLSPAASAHWLAMRAAASAGIGIYDLNGYVTDAAPDHPYAGVNRFKEQFRGRVIRYDVPEFHIS